MNIFPRKFSKLLARKNLENEKNHAKMKMKGVFIHKLRCGFQGHASDHYLRNFILNLRYYLPKFGLARKRVTGFLVAFEVALKGIHLLH
jgi:hypothetical protein